MKLIKLIVFISYISFFIIGSCLIIKTYASVNTGHEDFLEIYFDGDGKLINQFTDDEIDELAGNVDRKFFGWRTVHYQYNRRVAYDGKILFAKINKTNVPFYFEYKMTEEEIKTKSVAVNGSVSAKITGTIEKIKTTLTGSAGVEVDYDNESEISSQLTTYIEMNVLPNRKLTMITTGDAYITSGYSKFFIFGLPIRKGLWETIEVETVYYELREEIVK